MRDDKEEAVVRCESCGAHPEDATQYSGFTFCAQRLKTAQQKDATKYLALGLELGAASHLAVRQAPPVVATSEALRTLRTARERLTLAKASAKTARDMSSFPVTRDIDRAIGDLNGGLALLDEVIHFLAGGGK